MRYTLACILILASHWCFAVTTDDIAACTVCHGINLQGNLATEAPAIAGMEFWYIKAQLGAFRAGLRGTHKQDFSGMEMQPQAVILDDDMVAPISQFISNLPTQKLTSAPIGDQTKGRALYQACAACHGITGEGNEALGAPSLNGQNDWYLEAQLIKFQEGVRGQTVQGQQMRAAVGRLNSVEDVRDIVTYINTLENH